jgi:signal transduction histidine kinase
VRLGIRGKLIGTLILVGALPFALSVVTALLALGEVHTHGSARARVLLWSIALVAVAFIGLCFILGLLIAEREIIAPVLMLARAARELEEGHIHFRLEEPLAAGSGFRNDELGRLAIDFNRMAARLEKDLAELDWASHLKGQFIDIASHELRTPITYILGVLELAQRQGTDPTPLLAKIAAKAHRLSKIVENMFKLVESGSFAQSMQITRVDLAAVAQSAAAEAEPLLRQRSQRIQLKLPPAPLSIDADADKLRDILSNLLSNAIRFSPDSSTLTIEVNDTGEGANLIVSDEGPGMPQEQLQHLFEPIIAAAGSVGSHSSGEFQYMTRGMGLGMSVVKRFVEMHHGRVNVESSGKGTRIRVWLPRSVEPSINTPGAPQ